MEPSNSYTLKEVIEQRFDEMGTHLVDIKEQTTKTNGRVSNLENHRAYLWGAFSLLTLLGGLIAFLLVGAIDNKIKNGVDNALSQYEADVKGVEIIAK